MRAGLVALTASLAVGVSLVVLSPAEGRSATVCTWGGTPPSPTGVITLTPGLTNTPSTVPTKFVATGPLGGGAGCRGTFTFTGIIDPGTTCQFNAAFVAKAVGLPPVRRAVAQPGPAGTQPVLLYDRHGNVVGSEQAQFLTWAATNPEALRQCNAPPGLTRAHWSDTVEVFTSGG